MLGDHRRLEGTLGGQGRVLPVAAAAAAGVRVLARRGHPVGGRLADLYRVGAGELGRDLCHAGHDALPGQRVPHEDHRKPFGPGDAPAALRDVLDGHADVVDPGEHSAGSLGDQLEPL